MTSSLSRSAFLSFCSVTALLVLAAGFAFADTEMRPTGKGYGQPEIIHGQARPGNAKPPSPGGGGGLGNGISLHGGPVMLGTTHVYYIWYGNWAGNTATTILADLASNMASPYYNINTTYYDSSFVHVSNSVTLNGTVSDSYSRGKSLSDAAIFGVVSDKITSGALPKDPNGVYFVLTSSDVTASSGFCSNYCGWHDHGTVAGTDIKYSFVGNPDRCINACAPQTVGPNGNAGADGMASIVAHELVEAVTDPDLSAWYDNRGYENADKCAWTFGTTYTVNGAKANMKLGARHFLIQRNWVNATGGYCATAY